MINIMKLYEKVFLEWKASGFTTLLDALEYNGLISHKDDYGLSLYRVFEDSLEKGFLDPYKNEEDRQLLDQPEKFRLAFEKYYPEAKCIDFGNDFNELLK